MPLSTLTRATVLARAVLYSVLQSFAWPSSLVCHDVLLPMAPYDDELLCWLSYIQH